MNFSKTEKIGFLEFFTFADQHRGLNKQCKSKEEGIYQESIQSCTTPDTGHHMGMRQKHNKKHLTHESQEARLFPTENHSLGCKEQTRQYDKDK